MEITFEQVKSEFGEQVALGLLSLTKNKKLLILFSITSCVK